MMRYFVSYHSPWKKGDFANTELPTDRPILSLQDVRAAERRIEHKENILSGTVTILSFQRFEENPNGK
jgi:hypothetical protein